MQGNSRAPCFGADRAGDARSEVVQKSEWGRQVFMWGWGKGEVISSGEYQMLPLMTRIPRDKTARSTQQRRSHTEASESLTTVGIAYDYGTCLQAGDVQGWITIH
jgi:hypothetical protein